MALQLHQEPIKLYDVNQTCDALGIGRSLFYKLVREGHLQTVRVGRLTRVRHADLAAYLDKAQVHSDDSAA